MASPNTHRLILIVIVTAVQGLPTRMLRTEEDDTKKPSFFTKRSFHQTTNSEIQILDGAPNSEEVSNPDKGGAEGKLRERCNLRDGTTSPPGVTLEDWQVRQVFEAGQNFLNDSALLVNKDAINQPIVNITEEQTLKLLPYYRALFNSPLKQPGPTTESRARRATKYRVCPVDTVLTKPVLGINSEGGVVQIVQFNSMNMSQLFFEEKCLHRMSPISGASCVQVPRYVIALVIDLQSPDFKIEEQTIQVQSCASVLYI